MLLSFIVFGLYLSCEKGKNKLKEVGFGPLFKKRSNQNADEIASEILLKNGAKFLSFQRKSRRRGSCSTAAREGSHSFE